MFVPALPLPTGGVTHAFEVITVTLTLQMMIGRRTIWLPGWALRRELGPTVTTKAVPFVLRRIRWFERFSKPRGVWLFRSRLPLAGQGLLITVFAIGAFFSPPFSGLDTIPSLGAVFVALAIILEDVVVLIVGTVIGLAGIALSITLGAAAVRLFSDLF
jgi:hypothetical protein